MNVYMQAARLLQALATATAGKQAHGRRAAHTRCTAAWQLACSLLLLRASLPAPPLIGPGAGGHKLYLQCAQSIAAAEESTGWCENWAPRRAALNRF